MVPRDGEPQTRRGRISQPRRGWHPWLRLAAWGVVLFGLAAPIIRLTIGFDEIGFPITLVAALACLLWVLSNRGDLRTIIVYGVSIYFFTQLRDAADETSIAISTGYVLDWELWMFGGETPSAWLQDAVGGTGRPGGPLAFCSTFMHWSWFFFPHVIVMGTFFFARPLFFRVATIIVGTFFLAAALYYLVPTVPPWLAAELGATDGIVRILEDVGPSLFGQSLWDDLFDLFAEPNQNAAMPSLHFAASFVVVIIGLRLHAWRLTAGALLYSVLLAFALIYLGEHYFVDILVGGLTALAALLIVETALGNGPRARVPRSRRMARPRMARPRLHEGLPAGAIPAPQAEGGGE